MRRFTQARLSGPQTHRWALQWLLDARLLRDHGLPRTLAVLEGPLNDPLLGVGLRWLRRRAWPVAIDWHLLPYYGPSAAATRSIAASRGRPPPAFMPTPRPASCTRDGATPWP
jgi:hypothetical protein